MKKLTLIFAIILLLLAGILVLNRKQVTQTSSSRLQISTSFYPLYFFASQIGGNKADVSNITPASAEPHDYEPTTQDIVKINKSNMLVLNGGKLEAWGDKIKEQLKDTRVVIVTAADDIANKQIEEEGKIILDPHVWQDPLLAKEEVKKIETGFEKIDPQDKDYFKANEQKLDIELDKLNADFKQGLSACQKKDFVTSHAAFGYLASRYGINQIAISGVSPDEEPSSQKLAEISNLVKKEDIKVVFFETLVSPKLSQTIANETGAKAMVLDPIEGISDDDLKNGANYLKVMQDNLSALKTALECR